ncbi:MAG: AAA domain-containing protein [Bacteroidota bacterium]
MIKKEKRMPAEELEKVLELLALERRENYEYFKELMKSLSLEERVAKGYCWYPLNILKTGYTVGDRAYLIAERTQHKEVSHHFRSGKVVNFFTKRPRIHYPERLGVIDYLDKNKMRIILNTKDLPNWIKFDLFGVDLMFDVRTFEAMEVATKQVLKANGNRLASLRDVLLGHSKAQTPNPSPNVILPHLNKAQQSAVKNIIAAKDVAIIHGPPGTGKTTTLVYAVRELCKIENTVLVTAPSNAAVDLLTERLAELQLNVIRVGNISRVDDKILPHTLEVQVSNHPESKNVKKIRLQAVELRKKAWRIRRRYGRKERTERAGYLQEAKELSQWAKHLEDSLLDRLLSGAQVITCTLVGAVHPFLAKYKFRTVVIDEAAQALESATWIPITKASKVVLAGDPFQLPPTIKSKEAQKRGFDKTLIEKSIERLSEVNFLNVQYRMNKTIMQFSNQQFYDGALKADDTVAYHLLYPEDRQPLEFIDTAGCGFDEKLNEKHRSRYNPEEFQILCEHLYLLKKKLNPENMPSIALISPYREQVIHMEEKVREDADLEGLALTINTIDGFQGQERDIVYISLVRSNNKGEIGFLKDYRRMNVAMTRARKKLIIVGDSATISGDPFYDAFLKYCDEVEAYRTAWEFMA